MENSSTRLSVEASFEQTQEVVLDKHGFEHPEKMKPCYQQFWFLRFLVEGAKLWNRALCKGLSQNQITKNTNKTII